MALKQWFSHFGVPRNHLEDLWKQRLLLPTRPVDLSWSPVFLISDKIPGDAAVAGPGTTVWNDCPSGISHSCWQLGLGHSPWPYRVLSSIWASAHHMPRAAVATRNTSGPRPVSSGGWSHCYVRTAALEYTI